MQNTLNQEKNQRVVTFLNRDEVDFLDRLGKDALFSTGLKLSRAKLLAWLVEFMKKLNLDGQNIKSERDFEKRIMEVLGQSLKGSVPTSHGDKLTVLSQNERKDAKEPKGEFEGKDFPLNE